MRLFIFFLLATLSFASYGNENKQYQLLFHQSAEAKPISGSIENVIEAIREGKQIRLYMNLGFVEHAMDAGFLSIFEGNVYAQINEIQAQRPNRQTKDIELRPYSKHVGLYSTKSPYEIRWYSF